jgi:predicted phosphodiesterase
LAKWVKWLAFSCPHCPLEDMDAIRWMLERIRHHAPDVIVHLGDGHEAAGASKHPNEDSFTLKEEYAAHNKLLEDVRTTAELAGDKPVRCVFLPGNHDDNILAACRIDAKVRELCDFRLHEPELQNWEQPTEYVYNRKRGTFSLGQVTFAHGYECGQSSDEFQSILLSQYTHGLFVSGHTHRPVHVTRAQKSKGVPLPYWYANAGCMRDLKPSYVARKRTHGWGQAVVVGEAQLINSPRVTRQWEAQTEIFRWSDEL